MMLVVVNVYGYKSNCIYVIALLANALVTEIERGKSADFDHNLTKPSNFEKLIETLQSIVDSK